MFRIKICGVTRADDALAAIEAGADAIGINFYAKSARCVTVDVAARITSAVAGRALSVGVFVNTPLEEIERVAERAALDAIQLHGDEPPALAAEVVDWRLVRARRMDARGAAPIADDLDACAAEGRAPDALLVDAAAPGAYGGTGHTVSWPDLIGHDQWRRGVPLILAGGLSPENVADAIHAVRPQGVDVASGVESAPGEKDAERVRAFVQAALDAFRQ